MQGHGAIEHFVDGYVAAWDSNDPDAIAALFTPDASYFADPDGVPWVGHAQIVREWLAHRDEPNDHTFRYEVLARDGDLHFVRGWTTYLSDPPRDYANLWVVRLAEDGRASEFTDWWVPRA